MKIQFGFIPLALSVALAAALAAINQQKSVQNDLTSKNWELEEKCRNLQELGGLSIFSECKPGIKGFQRGPGKYEVEILEPEGRLFLFSVEWDDSSKQLGELQFILATGTFKFIPQFAKVICEVDRNGFCWVGAYSPDSLGRPETVVPWKCEFDDQYHIEKFLNNRVRLGDGPLEILRVVGADQGKKGRIISYFLRRYPLQQDEVQLAPGISIDTSFSTDLKSVDE